MADNPPMLRQSNRVEGKPLGVNQLDGKSLGHFEARKREQGFSGTSGVAKEA